VFSGGHFYLDGHLPALAQSVRTGVEQAVYSGAARQDQA
jgi:surfactin synthase thioesterase subunit